jgi:collagenase-like PrtC family protease
LNGVIVLNDLLADYIRQRKPGLKQICSVVKAFIENPRGDIDWYRRMQERFDRVVVHTDHMFDRDLLDQLDRDRAEILITEECIYQCPNRARHQTLNSIYNIAQFEDPEKAKATMQEIKEIREKRCAGGGRILDPERNPRGLRSCYLNHDEVKKIYDMGFRHLKISGRRKTLYGMAWNILNWVFNQDQAYIFARIIYSSIDQKTRTDYTRLAREKGLIPPAPAGRQG